MQALERIAGVLHLLPCDNVSKLWMRDAIRLRLAGLAPSLDHALGITASRRQPRQLHADARHRHICAIAHATGELGWRAAQAVVAIVAGARPAPEGTERSVEALQADRKCSRSIGGVYRILNSRLPEVDKFV
jgi:hypothetical protein